MKVSYKIRQNEELAFIKFGSRVYLYLPLNTEINEKIDDKVESGITTIGTIPAIS